MRNYTPYKVWAARAALVLLLLVTAVFARWLWGLPLLAHQGDALVCVETLSAYPLNPAHAFTHECSEGQVLRWDRVEASLLVSCLCSHPPEVADYEPESR
jgi:hypothetical protein